MFGLNSTDRYYLFINLFQISPFQPYLQDHFINYIQRIDTTYLEIRCEYLYTFEIQMGLQKVENMSIDISKLSMPQIE